VVKWRHMAYSCRRRPAHPGCAAGHRWEGTRRLLRERLRGLLRPWLTRENLFAVLLCLVLVLVVILTTDSAPQWIYQNF
jgi:hypothetical protein